MIKQFLEAGKIVGTHGVRGEMRLNPWCDSPAFLKGIKTFYLDAKGEKSIRAVSVRPHGNVTLIKLEGIESIETAETLRNTVLYINRNDKPLQKGENYIEDLLSCKVIDADDHSICYGVITDVLKGVANDAWTVKDENGKETLIPAIPSVIIETKTEDEIVYIRPLKGLFSDECIIQEDNE